MLKPIPRGSLTPGRGKANGEGSLLRSSTSRKIRVWNIPQESYTAIGDLY